MMTGRTSPKGARRLGLGTVQFGIDYGITNSAGKVAPDKVEAILAFAAGAGISMLDTAALYGDAEAVVGRANGAEAFDIVTKTVKLGDAGNATEAADMLARGFEQSLVRLGRERAYALLLHDPNDLLGPHGDAIWKRMHGLRSAGQADGIGISVYTGAEIDRALDRYDLDIVQVPINALDRRLETGGQLERLQRAGVEVHARSLFLQGVLLLPPEKVPANLAALRPALEAMRRSFTEAGLTVLEGLLASVMRYDAIDRLIVGAASLKEITEIAAAAERAENAKRPGSREHWAVADERLLNPAMWAML